MPQSDSPNPQGKGLVPILEAMAAYPRRRDTYRSPAQVLQAYMISRLVLCADFGFKPVPGQSYYLYLHDQGLNLSLIGPNEWGAGSRKGAQYLACCYLRPDMLWDLSDLQIGSEEQESEGQGQESEEQEGREQESERKQGMRARLQELVRELASGPIADLKSDVPLEKALPDYDHRLAFNQRVLANALSQTMRFHFEARLNQSLPRLLVEHHVQSLLPFGEQ